MSEPRPAVASPPVTEIDDTSTFVGREPELARLQAALAEARGGRGRLLLIDGEPGAGKTTLVEQATRNLNPSDGQGVALHLWGRCWEGDGAPPFWPWAHAFRSYIRDHDLSDLADELGDDAAELSRILPDLRRRFPDLPRLPDADSEQSRFRLFDRFSSFIAVAAATQPLVVVLDDLHWADDSSLRLLEFVAREIAAVPIALIATYRDTDISPAHPLALALGALHREPVTERLHVLGLSAPECTRFAAAATGAAVAAEVGEAIHARTNGNPLFVGEAVRWLAAEGKLASAAGEDVWRHGLPAGLVEVIGRRLAPLGAAATAVLELASLMGAEFDVETLATAAPELLPEGAAIVLVDTLDRAAARGLVRDEGPGQGRFRFAHDLIAEALRARIGPVRRAQLHARIGDAIEPRAVLPEQAATLAWHFSQAGSERAAKARQYARIAGDDAMAHGAYEAAARLYESALDPSPGSAAAPDRLSLLEMLANARRYAGMHERARDLYSDLAAHARETDDAPMLARVTLASAHVVAEYGRSDAALCARLDSAIGYVGTREPAWRSRLLARRAMESWSVDYDLARGMAEEAVRIATEADDPLAVAYAYYARFGGDLDVDRADASARMLSAGERAGDAELIAEARVQRLRGFLESAEPAAVAAEIFALQDLAARSRRPRHLWLAQMTQASWLITQGRFEEAESVARHAMTVGQRSQEPNASQVLVGQIARIRVEQGRLEEVASLLEAVTVEFPDLAVWHAALADLYARSGRHDEARRASAAVADRADWLGRRDNAWMVMIGYLADALAIVGDRDRCRRVYALLQPYTGRTLADDVGCYGLADLPLARMAVALGDAEAATEHFESVLAIAARMQALPALARSQHHYGTWLTGRNGSSERAESLLRAAQATARRLGMADLIETASAPAAVAATMAAPTITTAACAFRREGDFWTLNYRGSLTRMRDSKALGYLVRLLREPGREHHVADIAGSAVGDPSRLVDADIHVSRLDLPSGADAQAAEAYRRRLAEVREELAAAESDNDIGRQERLRAEVDFLLTELGDRLRVGNRARATGGLETVRNTVTKALRRQLAKIHQDHPALGSHLLASVRVGLWCTYRPETPVRWDLGD